MDQASCKRTDASGEGNSLWGVFEAIRAVPANKRRLGRVHVACGIACSPKGLENIHAACTSQKTTGLLRHQTKLYSFRQGGL